MDIDYRKHRRVLSTFKPAAWFKPAIFVIGVVLAVIAIAGLTEKRGENAALEVAAIIALLAASAWLIVQSARLGLKVTKRGLVYKGFFCTKEVRYTDLDHFEVNNPDIDLLGDLTLALDLLFSTPVICRKDGTRIALRSCFGSVISLEFKTALANYFVAPQYYERQEDQLIDQELLDMLATAQKFTPRALGSAAFKKLSSVRSRES